MERAHRPRDRSAFHPPQPALEGMRYGLGGGRGAVDIGVHTSGVLERPVQNNERAKAIFNSSFGIPAGATLRHWF